jgi:hypothetical protein
VGTALVKFEMNRSGKYFSINSVRLYGFYREPQPAGTRLGVDFAWQEKSGEKWSDKKKSLVVDRFPHQFDVECGGEAARVSQIVMKSME